jgi:hypothetical protein
MDDFHLALYRGASGETITVEDYAALDAAGRSAVSADPRRATISLVVAGRERLAPLISLGSLARLIPQVERAAQLLRAGEVALIRSGVLDVPAGHFLLIEAGDEQSCHISLIEIDTLPEGSWFPDSDRGDDLRAYVAAHHDALLNAARARGDDVVGLQIGRDALIAGMERTAAAARAIEREG